MCRFLQIQWKFEEKSVNYPPNDSDFVYSLSFRLSWIESYYSGLYSLMENDLQKTIQIR